MSTALKKMPAKGSSPEKWRATATLEDALGMGLSESEFKHVKDVLGREINMVEVGVCSALYSEHCSYKSSKIHLKTLPTEGEKVLHGPGENAGVIDIGDNQAVVFKVESHNHPTFIEPYQGAATGVGGILRDIFTMGARPLALLNGLRFGDLAVPRSKYLLKRAVAGIGGYGNCMGIPTVGGELSFHDSYIGNCLVNAFALGLVEHDKIFLGNAAGIGNSIIYVGSKTGRDGIHGATMSSAEFNDDSAEKRPTVQVGDPFQEKLLLEACLEVMQTGAVVGIQDMGAAGMTSSTYEMAERAGTGVIIHLDQVPMREAGMNPYEIMLSESQERMLICAKKGQESEVFEIFSRWGLDAVKIGEVVEGTNVDLFWHGENISSIPVTVLTSSVPQYRLPEAKPSDFEQKNNFPIESISPPEDLSKAWLKLLSSENVCSRAPVYRQYDSTVRSNTVVHPGGDAAVIRIKSTKRKTEKGVAMTLDCNSRYCATDPHQGTALSLAESCRNIAAVGAAPIGISDCLNFGSPERADGMWQIAESIRGLGQAARAFEIPIVSGNVSLRNETKGRAISPTPMLAVVGLIDDVSKCVTANFQNEGDIVFVVGLTDDSELGSSEYMACIHGVEKGKLPVLNYDLEINTANFIREAISKRLFNSCHDISQGGIAIALAECCFADYASFGASIKLEPEMEKAHIKSRKDGILFAETGARYIVSCTPENEKKVRDFAKKKKIPLCFSGKCFSGKMGGDSIEITGFAKISLTQAYKAWKEGLEAWI